jgi:hypothetical protein
MFINPLIEARGIFGTGTKAWKEFLIGWAESNLLDGILEENKQLKKLY